MSITSAATVLVLRRLCSYYNNGQYHRDLIERFLMRYTGFGSPVAAAQGLGFLQEFVARFVSPVKLAMVLADMCSANETFDRVQLYYQW